MINNEATAEAHSGDMESTMIDLRNILVADHIQGIERDAAARAGRRRVPRAAVRKADPRGGVAASSVRVRVGRWLVGVGQAISGPPVAQADDAPSSMPNAA